MDTNSPASHDEQKIIQQVKAERCFYQNLLRYALIIPLLFIINMTTAPHYIWAWFPAIGWGIALVFHAISVFLGGSFHLFGDSWQQAQIEKRLHKR